MGLKISCKLAMVVTSLVPPYRRCRTGAAPGTDDCHGSTSLRSSGHNGSLLLDQLYQEQCDLCERQS